MRKVLAGLAFLPIFVVIVGNPSVALGFDQGEKAEALWRERETPGKAAEGISAYETLLEGRPGDYEVLLRLSRLHYWVGQNLEQANKQEALAHYGKGGEYGRMASEIAPEKPGGYFFEAANLARQNNLKGSLSNVWGVSTVRKLNEKTAEIDPDYFYRGPDRFFCAFFTKLPGLLGGSTSKAIEYGKRAVAAYPNYAGNRFFLAEAYLKNGNNDLARKELEAAAVLSDTEFPGAVPEQRIEKKRAEALLKRIGK